MNISIIVCKINFGSLCLTLTSNLSCKKIATKYLFKNLSGTKNFTLKKLYCITISIRKQLCWNLYNLYNYVLHYQLLLLNERTPDESYCTFNVWTIYIPLFINLMRGYVCKINFVFICPTCTCNSPCKKLQLITSIKNLTGTKNLTPNTVYHINIGIRKQLYHHV